VIITPVMAARLMNELRLGGKHRTEDDLMSFRRGRKG